MQRHSQRSVEATVTGGELVLRARVDELEDALARLAARNAKDVVRLRRCEQQNELLREQCVGHQTLVLRAESLAAEFKECNGRAAAAEEAASDARTTVAALRHTIAKHEMAEHVAKAAMSR